MPATPVLNAYQGNWGTVIETFCEGKNKVLMIPSLARWSALVLNAIRQQETAQLVSDYPSVFPKGKVVPEEWPDIIEFILKDSLKSNGSSIIPPQEISLATLHLERRPTMWVLRQRQNNVTTVSVRPFTGQLLEFITVLRSQIPQGTDWLDHLRIGFLHQIAQTITIIAHEQPTTVT